MLISRGGHAIVAICAMAVIGWLTVIGVYHLAKRLFNEKAAFLAALLTGIYPNLIYFGANLFPETLAIFWIVFSFLGLPGLLYRKLVI